MKSPITQQENTRCLATLHVDEIIKVWDEVLGIDVSAEFNEIDLVKQYKCLDTDFQFFRPVQAAGGDAFYQSLEQFDWYYMAEKWEHETAEKDIQQGDRVLEVGCGKGDFVHRLNQDRNVEAIGIELNSSAVQDAQAKNRNVIRQDLADVAQSEPNSFDVVCHFQVLEHISDPMGFLQLCLDCLKPGGCLLISVPNMAGFIADAERDVMNMPPHHMGQWFPSTFQCLSDYLPVSLGRIEYEPLAEYHKEWHRSIRVGAIDGSTLLGKIRRSLTFRFLYYVGEIPVLRKLVRGHSQYVCFYKQDVDEAS